MDIKVIIKDATFDEKVRNDVINVTMNETSADSTVEETRNRTILSSRLDFMKQSSQEKYRKSVMCTSRQGPLFPRYSHKEAKVSVALCGKFTVLPEIRGQNLFVNEKERSYENNSGEKVKEKESKVDTLQQLQSTILHYGSKTENIWMGFNSSKFHPMLVRPGFSARRYLANLSKNLNEELIKKLMCEGYLLEKNLYTSNSIMPHIRRRLSDDLSRYPEPYRILRHMLMAPGPLNEYSFVWSCKKDLREDISFMYNKEMEHGDIKILSKKTKNGCEDEFEEVQYAKLSGHKKKTILSNLLMKSAMNHALRVKEEMMEYNNTLLSHKVTGRAHNIHIPVVKFDMKVAITDLLTKETLQTLTTTEIDLPFNADPINNKFKGYGLKVNKHKEFSPIILEGNDAEAAQTTEPAELDSTNAENKDQRNRLYKRKLPFNEESVYHHFKSGILKRSKVNVPRRTNLFKQEEPHLNVFDLTEPIVDVNEDQEEEKFNPQNLTLTLNEAHPHKHNKKRDNKSDLRCGKESVLSDSNINLNPLEEAMKNTHSRDVQTQGLAFAKMIKERAQMAKLHNESVRPYGKYRDPEGLGRNPDLADSGDIDPTISFVHWKYKDDHSLQYASVFRAAASTDVKGQRLTDALHKEQNHSRLVTLLRGQADSVAEAVLARSEGGVDFASDVNVAIRDIIGESQYQKEQVWNLEVNDLKKESEYKGVITNIFKSIFKDELQNLGGEDLDLSPTLMKLLQSGYNLKLEDLEMVMDPMTGRMIASLKKGVQIPKEALDSPKEMLDDSHMSLTRSEELSLMESRSIIASSISPFDINRTPTVLTPEMKRILQSSNIKVSVPKIPSNQEEVHGKLHAVSELGEIEHTNENEVNERIEEENKEGHDPQKQHTKNVVMNKNSVVFDGGDQRGLERKYHNVMDPQLTESDQTIDKDLHKVQQDYNSKEELFGEDTGNKIKESLDQEGLTNSKKGVDIAWTELIHKEGLTESRHTLNIDPSSTQEDCKNAKSNDKIKNIPESIKNVKYKPSVSQKLPTAIKAKDKGKKTAVKGKNNNAKKDFTFGHTNETKDIKKLYNNTEPSNLESIKSKKSFEKKKKNIKTSEEFEKEDSGDIHFQNESTVNSIKLAQDKKDHSLEKEEEEDVNEYLSEEEIKLGDGDEIRRQKQLMRQNRVDQKRAEVQRLRKEEEMKRKKMAEDRKIETQRMELEEIMRKKLEEERKRKEEEFLLQKEKEREEEQALLDAEKRKECFRLRQIEKERQQREEFNRIIEEGRIRQAIEDRLKKEEQEMREREEAALLEKMNEDERNEYLKQKAELLEKQRLEEEEERMLKEEIARVALEEAKAIAKQQALEKTRLEEIRKMRIEDEGLKKYLNVTPAFVWSYFEFLNILGVNDNCPSMK